jgi:hypothetical protein
MLLVGRSLIVDMFLLFLFEVFWMLRSYYLLSGGLDQSINHGNRLQSSHHTHTNTAFHARVTVWRGTRRVGVQTSETDSVTGEQTEGHRPERCRRLVFCRLCSAE